MKIIALLSRFGVLVLVVMLLNSCVVLDVLYRGLFEKGSYSYQYVGGKKSIDFREGKWLIASYDPSDINFFKQYLNNRLMPLNMVKDEEGKLAYNFDIDYNVSDKELKRIRDLTHFDYLITLNDSSNHLQRKWTKDDSYVDKRQTCMVNVYNLSSGFLEYQIVCVGESETDDDKLFQIDTKFNLLRKIDRYAKH